MMQIRQTKFKDILCALMLLTLGGCGSILGPVSQREIVDYEIMDTSINGQSGGCEVSEKSDIIFVAPMRANSPYNSAKMHYSNNKFELSQYSYSQWAALPTDMLTQSIIKKLVLSCQYKNVVMTNALANADYSLVTQLVTLRDDISNNGKNSTIRMIIYVQLIDLGNNSVVASKTFMLSQDAAVGPGSFASSASDLLTTFDNDLVAWLKQH